MPVDMLFKYHIFLLLCKKYFSAGSQQLNCPTYNKTRPKIQYVPTTVEVKEKVTADDLWTAYLQGESERSAGICTVGMLCIAAAGEAL